MMNALFRMTLRNIKIYLKDRANVFFSLLAPLIILLLYVLFIGQMQIDAILDSLRQLGISGGVEEDVRAFSDSWMLTGVMACACITVALCASGIIVQDRSRGILADTMASPVPRWLTTVSYFCSVVIVALVICLIVLAVCFIYLAAIGNWYLSVSDVFGCIGVTLLSVLSSTTVVVLIASVVKTEGAFSGVNIIIGTVIGFLIGAYMPISTFPKAIQYLTLLIPGSYSAGLYRQYFMGGALANLAESVPHEFAEELAAHYSMTYDFFGIRVEGGAMAWILAASVLLFGGINFLVIVIKRRKKQL